MQRIAIFASGNGSNAENIIRHLQSVVDIQVSLILTNNPNARVLDRASKHKLPAIVFNKSTFYDTEKVLSNLKSYKIDWVILAGFMWLIPSYIIRAYPQRILNIHPALLPTYGGKGMYGDRVHKAVKAANESETGITIHYVNEAYDEGQIVFQASTSINLQDTVDSIADKVHALEYTHYPKVIEAEIRSRRSIQKQV